MSVTKKFAYILSLGLIFLPFAFINQLVFVLLLVIYDLACLIFLIIDYRLSPSSKDFSVVRSNGDKLYFKAPNTISFNVRNNSEYRVLTSLRDDQPSLHFKLLSEDMTHELESGSERFFSYETMPTKRGAFTFHDIYVKIHSNWGLCNKFFTIKSPFEYKVYPNLKDLSKYRLIMSKSMLETGEKHFRAIGLGTEFESLREYVEGDDYRKINWMATARENKLILNQYETEKNQPVFIMIDTGRAMSYSVKGYKKLDYAINAALILSDIVNYRGDQTGLVVFDTDVRAIIPPGKGDVHRSLLMDTLYHIEDTRHTSDYETAFRELIQRQKRRSLIFIMTDFETLVESSDLIRSISILKNRHLPIIVLIKNDGIHSLASSGARDLRGNIRKTVARQAIEDRSQLLRLLNTNGITCIESEAERFALDTINSYLHIKNKNAL